MRLRIAFGDRVAGVRRHPNMETVVWEIDTQTLAPALEPRWGELPGYLRLVFSREEYEADVRAMLRAIRTETGAQPPVEDLEPDRRKGLAFEEAMAVDCERPWVHQPVLPASTVVEFGFRGSELLTINGCASQWWPTNLFTRWAAYAAFEEWTRYITRRYALKPAAAEETGAPVPLAWESMGSSNDFVLRDESDRAACDRVGETLARLGRDGYAEWITAPGVEVGYRAYTGAAGHRDPGT